MWNASLPIRSADLRRFPLAGYGVNGYPSAMDSREALVADLEALRSVLQREGRERDEDTVLEAMDSLVGWCSPGAEL